jgi:hypothetical protein
MPQRAGSSCRLPRPTSPAPCWRRHARISGSCGALPESVQARLPHVLGWTWRLCPLALPQVLCGKCAIRSETRNVGSRQRSLASARISSRPHTLRYEPHLIWNRRRTRFAAKWALWLRASARGSASGYHAPCRVAGGADSGTGRAREPCTPPTQSRAWVRCAHPEHGDGGSLLLCGFAVA